MWLPTMRNIHENLTLLDLKREIEILIELFGDMPTNLASGDISRKMDGIAHIQFGSETELE